MSRKVTAEDMFNGKKIDWANSKEYWNEYKLTDGTTLKVKLTLRGIVRLEKHSPNGDPIYMIDSMNIVRALNVESKLRKKPKKSEMNPV